MYQGFYGLQDHPFRLTADPAYICLTSQHREALSALVYTTRTGLGLTVLVGEAGTGKTTVLSTLVELLEARNFVVARCNNPTLNRDEFYDMLLAELGVECDSPLKSRRLKALEEALTRFRAEGRSAVLIVDEAQKLPLELLEEIRLLLNMETPQEKMLQIVMAGQPELGDVLSQPELRQLKQRVSAFCRLEPLTLDELREYVQHRLSRAGLPKQKLFPADTVDLVFRYTQGIPRLVNSLCDAALQTGFALQSPSMTAAIIHEAAEDLDLLDRSEQAAPGPKLSVQNETPEKKESLPVEHANVIPMPITNPDVQLHKYTAQEANGDEKIPMEGYASRQRSLSFLGQLLDRWK